MDEYCPKCDGSGAGETVRWHRTCAMAVLGALMLKSVDPATPRV